MDSAGIEDLLLQAAGRVQDDAAVLAEQETFDLAYSALRSFDQLPADAQRHACKLTAAAVQQATRACKRSLASLLIMLSSMGLATAIDDVATVWGFLGSTAAILLGLTFPCLAYVRLRKTPQNRSPTWIEPDAPSTSGR